MHNPQLRKNPSPNHRPNQPNQNIANTPKPAPPCHLSRQPTRQQPNQQPPNQSPLPLHNHHPLLQRDHPKQNTHLHPPNLSALLCVLCAPTSVPSVLKLFSSNLHPPTASCFVIQCTVPNHSTKSNQ